MTKRKRQLPATRKMTIAEAISEAHGELTGLGEEMNEWADNMEEKFSSTDKYERVREAGETLSNLTEPEVCDALKDIEVEWMDLPQRKRPYSRADRNAQACYILEQCMNALDTVNDAEENKPEEERNHDRIDEAEGLRVEIEQIKDEAEGVEFPGMFG